MRLKFKGVPDKEFIAFIRSVMKCPQVKATLKIYDEDIARFEFHALTVYLNPIMKTYGGWAKYHEKVIELHYRLLKANGEGEIRQVFLHELAHFITRAAYPAAEPHGKEFMGVLMDLGGRPERCHAMETKDFVARDPELTKYATKPKKKPKPKVFDWAVNRLDEDFCFLDSWDFRGTLTTANRKFKSLCKEYPAADLELVRWTASGMEIVDERIFRGWEEES